MPATQNPREKDFRENCHPVGEGWGYIYRHDTSGGLYYTGFVTTDYGLVGVYKQVDADDPSTDHTRLWFASEGLCYERTYRRFYSDRYTKTLAKRFAYEMVNLIRVAAAQARYEELEREEKEQEYSR